MKSVQICLFPGRMIEFTALQIGERISCHKNGPLPTCKVYPVLNSSALLIKLDKFATKN